MSTGIHPSTMKPAQPAEPFSASILIVDDHAAVRDGLKNLISSRPGWLVCGEAENGDEAIARALQLKPSAVVMDISMPGMDGLEATRRLREQLPSAEIVIVSQQDSGQLALEAERAGARGFVPKSHLPSDLLPALEAALHHRSFIPNPGNQTRHEAGSSRQDGLDLVSGGGEMGKRMQSLDWAQTPLGPIQQWPQSLKTSLSICLASRFPIVMYWGPEYVVLYNDAYSAILGSKHPWALGQRCRDCWAEIWDTIGPMLDEVVHSGQATWSDDLRLMLRRHGYPEECYFCFSFSPIRIETAAVGGVFTAVMETTDKVIGERRLRTLRDLAARAVNANSEPEALRIAAATLSENLHDVPFSVLCQVADSDDGVRVLAAAGIDQAHPLLASLSSPEAKLGEALRRAAKSREMVELRDLCAWAGELPCGAWQAPPLSALVAPIGDLGPERAAGALLAAVSPHKKLNDTYRTFFQLVAHQIAASVADARSHEEERKRAEALAELDRAKTAFFSNVSHEFRTPLTLMLGPLEDTLAARDDLSGEQRQLLEVAHRNSLRLLKLVNTLLDFSRIEAGRIQACYEPTDLATLTSELAGVFRAAIERAGLRFIVNCPPLGEPVHVDREMWEKIVFNLLSNAFKFTFQGEIEVSLQKSDGKVEVAVRDTGTGIPESEQPHLFERFYRVKGAHGRTFEGSGIGLALVQELARLHGGSVHVHSRLNQGTTFTISLPLGKEHLPPDRIGAARGLESTGLTGEAYVEEALRWLPEGGTISEDVPLAAVLSPASARSQPESAPLVLLADDNADMREYVQRLLGSRYRVTAVADGQAALEAARRHPPDLVLADIMMPRLDGFALLEAMRREEQLKTIPVILLSARAGEESRIEGLQSGADDYLVKPFSARELLARLNAHLSMAQLRRHSAEQERNLRAQVELERERFRQLINALPAAIYCTDAEGRLTYFNQAAVEFSGRVPELGTQKWCVTWKLFRADGSPLPHDQAPMAIALKEGRSIFGEEVIAERPDGTRRWFTPFPTPLRDAGGKIVGGINMLLDITERKRHEQNGNLLAAIVSSSDDAIVSKNLNGIITSWNKSAERIFGYTAEEAVGRHITLIIPRDRLAEEDDILARLRRGERIDHFQTIRQRKDGVLIDVSLTISPVRNSSGRTIGASKVARDITLQKRAEQALRDSEERLRRLTETLETEVRARTRELEDRNADVLRQSEQLRQLSWRLLRIQDEERRHIARELHDSAGQTLTVLGINLAQLVQKAARTAPSLAADAEKIEEVVRQLSREVRTTSYLLHPPLLDESGLASALSWYVQGLVQRSGLDIQLNIAEDFGRLPGDMELVIFRLVQECLTNIHRHSGSKTAIIRLMRHAGRITAEIQDQGKGMSPERLAEVQSRGAGVGIRGLRERLRQFEGTLNIESDSSGTRVLVTIPVPANSREQNGTEPLQAAV